MKNGYTAVRILFQLFLAGPIILLIPWALLALCSGVCAPFIFLYQDLLDWDQFNIAEIAGQFRTLFSIESFTFYAGSLGLFALLISILTPLDNIQKHRCLRRGIVLFLVCGIAAATVFLLLSTFFIRNSSFSSHHSTGNSEEPSKGLDVTYCILFTSTDSGPASGIGWLR